MSSPCTPAAAGSEPAGATLRVVRGDPTPEELAVVAAVVTAAASSVNSAAPARTVLRGRWNDPAVRHRRPWYPGPGAWRATVWSR
jgi:hypothetical protein